jgi:hypothetical protein
MKDLLGDFRKNVTNADGGTALQTATTHLKAELAASWPARGKRNLSLPRNERSNVRIQPAQTRPGLSDTLPDQLNQAALTL